ncbi:MAG: hypothetical protein IPL65_17010 [Lewinellaceae bacterium]|nr:hypothetical protein [Lewinellaceae bacterium]
MPCLLNGWCDYDNTLSTAKAAQFNFVGVQCGFCMLLQGQSSIGSAQNIMYPAVVLPVGRGGLPAGSCSFG